MTDPPPSSSSADRQNNIIISTCFHKVSSLIRNTPPDTNNPISDSIRLQLYGYYKCATSEDHHPSSKNTPRPSFFDPVGRAKYDAWVECEQDCEGNRYVAMRRYVEVAASQSQTATGRECDEMLQDLEKEIDTLKSAHDGKSLEEHYSGAIQEELQDNFAECENIKDEIEDVSIGKSSVVTATVKNANSQSPKTFASHSNKAMKSSQSYSSSLKSWINSILPTPLIPRGQLDISILDFFYALHQCLQHFIYKYFIGQGGLLHKMLSFILPNFVMALVNIALLKYHPRQRAQWYEGKIEQRWLKMDSGCQDDAKEGKDDDSREVVVGLSVRSLLDLYLSARSLPAGSEVIIVPPVTIPGMIDVMTHHDLVLVPIDLPGATKSGAAANSLEQGNHDSAANQVSDGGTSNSINNDADATTKEDNLYVSTRWGIDPSAVKAAITKKTVAIFIVHPFGTIIANAKTMKELRTMANEHNLEIWEDCAQCYTGSKSMSSPSSVTSNGSSIESEESSVQLGYTGSRHADISFFSFGPIKTATALGGGLALLRDNNETSSNNVRRVEEVAKTMRRMQDTMYRPQTNFSYLVRVVKCFALHFASHSRLLCGLAKAVVEKAGWDYDTFVVSSLRGFAASSAPDINDGKRGVSKRPVQVTKKGSPSDNTQRNELIQQLRRRPCMAMLALLHRRLLDSEKTHESVMQRTNRCHAFAKRLLSDASIVNITLLKNIDGACTMFGWLFPILLPDPQRASKMLLQLGFDVPCGMTQLKPIMIDGEDVNGCPRARSVFDHILYLPVMSLSFSAEDQTGLIKALADVSSPPDTSGDGKDGNTSNQHMLARKSQQRPILLRNRVAYLFIGLIEWQFAILGLFQNIPVQIILRLMILVGPWIGAAVSFALLSLLALSRYMGPIYLKSSNTFTKYCDMLFQSPFQHDPNESKDDMFAQSKTVLELESTKVPTVSGVPAGKANSDVNESQMVLLTGATGFIGSLLLRELLLHRRSLSIPGGVIVIVRSKRGKTARERMDCILSQPMFDFLSENERQSLVHVIEGDVTLPDCGMECGEVKSLCQRSISRVFHCAAAVSFSQSLEDAAVSNITSSLQLHMLTKRLRRKDAKFVYVSTAFVHGGKTGTRSEPLPEELFSLYPYDPIELYKSMLGSQSYASAAMNELGFPNTYSFSKCLCEHLLQASENVETIIIRPSIVGPSVHEPFEGWAGEKPSTIVAAACLYLKFPYNMWCFGKVLVPFIPVDVVCRCIISKSFGDRCLRIEPSIDSFAEEAEDEKKEMSPSDICEENYSQNTIATVAWDASSPASSSFSWLSYAFSITHLGAVCGHVNRVVAYAGLLMSTRLFPWLNFRLATFQRLHFMFVRTPFNIMLDLCGKFPMKPRILRDLKALSPVIDLPMLFFPFANQSFHFKSDLVAPLDFNGERYMFSCAVAAHRFIQMIERQRSSKVHCSNFREYGVETTGGKNRHSNSSVVVAGSNHVRPTSDLWWALTQPKGNLAIRLGGWILAKIFRHTSMEIEIDVASFKALSRELPNSSKSTLPHVIIAPTHRSFYDFLIVSYICFSLPELGLDSPHIAAASDFASIPIIGWFAKKLGAFFLKRDGTKNDSNLEQDLARITGGKQEPAFIEVFIEGKRSRNRTFTKPKTGFLRCLAGIGCKCIIFPLTINYEGIPDEASLMKEANTGFSEKMSLVKLVNWMRSVFAGHINIGRVYVSASESLVLPSPANADIRGLTHAIQTRHQSRVMVSDFHIQAASLALELSEKVVIDALMELGCHIWPQSEENAAASLQMPDNPDLLWAAMLQFGHLFGPFLVTSHPMWSSWISPSLKQLDTKGSSNRATKILLLKLIAYFELAEKAVEHVLKDLKTKGFGEPDEKHVIQYLPAVSQLPMFLMRVAVKDKVAGAYSTTLSHRHSKGHFSPLFPSRVTGAFKDQWNDNPDAEAFGAWGYQDSYFALNVEPDGSKRVTMKGSRYSISGKPLSGLANFVEKELNVIIDPNGVTFPSCGDLRNIPKGNLTTEDTAKIIALLDSDASRISSRPGDRARHGTGHTQEDMYDLRTGLIRFRLPDAVVWPQNEGEVQALISLASQNDWCLLPFGGGTNVTHSTHCPNRVIDPRPMISVDMKLMNRVLWVNEEDGLAHVEAGITGIELIKHVQKLGFTIGHEPDSYEFSTLGGWIATKASGMKQNKYGNIEDIVREVSVVGAKGSLSHKHKMEKSSVGRSSTGVDLKSLMLGSEGCFGIIVSAVLKIWPLAESRSHESVLLPNFDTGIRYMKDLSKMHAMKPASARLLDNQQFRLGQALKESTSRYESLRHLVSKKIGYYLGNFSEKSVVCATITFEGTLDEVKMQKKTVRDLASVHGGIVAGPTVGKAGYDLTFAIAYLRDFALNYNILGESFETFVPWSKLTQVIQATKQRIYTEHSSRALPGVPLVCCRITQLYDDGACVYFYFCMKISCVAEPSHVFSAIERSARQEILDNGGSLSHHHGLGKLRSPFVRQIYSQGYIDTLVSIKGAIDPNNTFGARNGVFSMMHTQETKTSNAEIDQDFSS